MENSNPLDSYTYSNIGQARAIMQVLGYSENYEKEGQKLTFNKGNEIISSSFEDIRERVGKIKDTLPEEQNLSKEFISKEFDKDRATNDFKSYQEELSKQGIFIVKWDKDTFQNGKQNSQNENVNEGFTIIDTKNNAAYTGKELYSFATENGYFLNPKIEKEKQNTTYDIKDNEPIQKYTEQQVSDILEKRGIDKTLLDKDSIHALMNGGKTSLLDLNIQNENVKGKLEIKENNGELALHLNNIQRVAPTSLKIDGKDIDLTKIFNEDDKIKLQKGEIINKAVPDLKGEKLLFQYDKEINNFVVAKEKNIKIDFALPQNERNSLLQGNAIRLNTQKGDYLMKLDLLDNTGMKIKKAQDYSQEKDLKLNNGQSVNKKDENKPFKKDVARALVAGLLLGCPLLGAYFLLRNINKKDIDKYKLTSNDINNLLDGKKTDIKRIEDKDVRLSLKENQDKSLSIVIHPKQQELKFDDKFNFTDQEKKNLLDAKIINKDYKGEKYIFQADLKTNEILTAKEKEAVPDKIRDIELSSTQKENLKIGLPIMLDVNGEKISAQLDLNNKGFINIEDDKKILLEFSKHGYDGIKDLPNDRKTEFLQKYDLVQETKAISEKLQDKSEAMKAGEHSTVAQIGKEIGGIENGAKEKTAFAFEHKQKVDFDRFNAGVVDIIPTDENRAEYMALITKNNDSMGISKGIKM